MTALVSEFNLIKEGDYLIVKIESTLRLIELKKNKPHIFLGKRKANLFSAIGHQYGSFFEIKSDGSLKKVTISEMMQDMLLKVDGDEEIKDNRSLLDSGESQKLTTSDIESYKAQGLSGQEMVKIIVENSSSFREKTVFSKEKYLRKKQMKYLKFVQLLKPNVRLLAEMYYSQGPLKICNLRVDTLSQMLTFCNIMSGGRYIIIETVLGLLTTAVVERLDAQGCVVQMHLGPFSLNPCQQAIKALNISSNELQSLLYNIDLKDAMSLLKLKNLPVEDMHVDTCENYVSQDTLPVERKWKSEKEEQVQKARDILSKKNMDSLLVAVKHHPANVLPLIDFLAFSRPFAIFSMYREPLVDCYVSLKARGDIILLNVSETWFRKYQVLPDRTHPFYSMSGNGGFLLTGIKVERKP